MAGPGNAEPADSRNPRCRASSPTTHDLKGHTMPKTCECGCGQAVPLAKQTDSRSGHMKGQPIRFIHGHHLRLLVLPKQPCTVEGCDTLQYGRGWCVKHHGRWRRTGSPTGLIGHKTARIPIQDRLTAQIEKTESGCWLWTGNINSVGYGTINYENRTRHVHRLTYELLRGAIPSRLQLDHLCRVRHCCNPAHLEAVTSAENSRRGNSPASLFNRTGKCQRGHDLAAIGIYVSPKGRRLCRGCIALRRTGGHRPRAG